MNSYIIKHEPTGLYYNPTLNKFHTQLSFNGKIYKSTISGPYFNKSDFIPVYIQHDNNYYDLLNNKYKQDPYGRFLIPKTEFKLIYINESQI